MVLEATDGDEAAATGAGALQAQVEEGTSGEIRMVTESASALF